MPYYTQRPIMPSFGTKLEIIAIWRVWANKGHIISVKRRGISVDKLQCSWLFFFNIIYNLHIKTVIWLWANLLKKKVVNWNLIHLWTVWSASSMADPKTKVVNPSAVVRHLGERPNKNANGKRNLSSRTKIFCQVWSARYSTMLTPRKLLN